MTFLRSGIAGALALLISAPAAAQAPNPNPNELSGALTLRAHGGVTVKVPGWKQSRSGDAVAVYEQIPSTPADDGFHMLVLVVEEGPAAIEQVAWQGILDNVVAAAGQGGTQVALTLAGDHPAPSGYAAQRMTGTVTVESRKLPVEVVALVRPGQLVTISVVAAKVSQTAAQVASQVAASATGQ